jgi:UDP-N-acetylmuramoylalanine--D-glutamate ligase
LYNKDNEVIQNRLKDVMLMPKGIAISENMIHGDLLHVEASTYDMSRTSLKGKHNYMNALFAIHVAKAVAVLDGAIQKGLETFVNAPHRMELVVTIDGVEYINDSKATNVDSVFYALQAMAKPTIWIVGGQDKGNDYQVLVPFVTQKVKFIIAMGLDNSKIIQAFGEVRSENREARIDIIEVKSAREAVETAKNVAKSGDVVLLSPACASFDLFKNYEDRGNQFKQEVLKLK